MVQVRNSKTVTVANNFRLSTENSEKLIENRAKSDIIEKSKLFDTKGDDSCHLKQQVKKSISMR